MTIKEKTEWLPIPGHFSQLQPQSLQLIGEADKLCSFISILWPVFAVFGNGSTGGSLIPFAFMFALLVTPDGLLHLFPGHVGNGCFLRPTNICLCRELVRQHLHRSLQHLWNLLKQKQDQMSHVKIGAFIYFSQNCLHTMNENVM